MKLTQNTQIRYQSVQIGIYGIMRSGTALYPHRMNSNMVNFVVH